MQALLWIAVLLACAGSDVRVCRTTFQVYRQARAEYRVIRERAKRAIADRADPAVVETLASEAREAGRALRRARAAFRSAFRETRLEAWDPGKDADLIQEGLLACADYELDVEPERAVRRLEILLQRWPRASPTLRARLDLLPYALVAVGRNRDAIETVEKALPTARRGRRPELLLLLGDLYAVAGDSYLARHHYQRARRAGNDRVIKLADVRLGLLGDPAPELVADPLAGPRFVLAAQRGRVVVLDFFATWSRAARKGLGSFSKLYQEYAGDGLVVVELTRFYDRGFLPVADLEDHGEVVTGLDQGAFRTHIRAFQARARLRQPFAIVGPIDFHRFGIRGVPTTIVVDPAGTVSLVVTGARGRTLARAAALALLRRTSGR